MTVERTRINLPRTTPGDRSTSRPRATPVAVLGSKGNVSAVGSTVKMVSVDYLTIGEPKIRELGYKRIEFLDEDGMPVAQSAAR